MGKYLVWRFLAAIPVLFGVLLVVFVLLRLVPGDPVEIIFESGGRSSVAVAGRGASMEQVEALRASYNLDKPMPVQFFIYMKDMLTGNFGRSFQTNQQIGELVKELFPHTLQLTFAGMGVALLIGLLAGMLSAIRHHTWVDYLGQFVAVFGVSVPDFFFGLLMIFLFSMTLDWLPSIGQDHPLSLLMPAVTLGVSGAAIIARLTRSSMLDVLSRDYIRTARAKGVRERGVVWGHALKNALIPVITIVGLQFGGLLTGAIVIEVVFTRQGSATSWSRRSSGATIQ